MVRRARRWGGEVAVVDLTSVMDIMTILLVFLLKSYGTQPTPVAPQPGLALPVSTAEAPPTIAVHIVVSQAEILVDGINVLSLALETEPISGRALVVMPGEAVRDGVVVALAAALAEKGRRVAADGPFDGRVLLSADKSVPFSVLREVMHTASVAGFEELRFVVSRE